MEAGEREGRRAAKNSSCGNRGSAGTAPCRARAPRAAGSCARSRAGAGARVLRAPAGAPSCTPAPPSRAPQAAGICPPGPPACTAALISDLAKETEESWVKAMTNLRHNAIGSDFWRKISFCGRLDLSGGGKGDVQHAREGCRGAG